MADEKKIPAEAENEEESPVIELIDEDGTTYQFEVLASYETEDAMYLAVIAADEEIGEDGVIEYGIVKSTTDENGEELFVSLDDDDPAYDDIADYFDDLFAGQVDYD